jgi:hypothetical protein
VAQATCEGSSVSNGFGWLDLWARRRADLAALAVVVLFFVVCFGRFIWHGQFLIGGDVFFYTYPLRTVAWRMLRAGDLPLWTPHVLSGYPLLAMAQLGLGYPLTWGHLFLPPHWAEEIYVLAPFLLAPAFTYAYVRELGRSRLAALLAGLTYSYSGLTTNSLGMNGIMTNALMWLPLMLIASERARTRPFVPCLLWATFAYTMSVLTGLGQGFCFVGIVALAYAVFLSIFLPAKDGKTEDRPPLLTWTRWRPVCVAVCAIVLAAGVAAFQIAETMRALRLSVRRQISYEFFSQGSFTPLAAWKSFAAPLYHFIDDTTYIALPACILAVCAVIGAMRNKQRRDVRVFFWLATALVALSLMLGSSTPLYPLLYHVPLLNLFRNPSRHAFEWTFALATLAAYGWDTLSLGVDSVAQSRGRRELAGAYVLLLVGVSCGVLWWRVAHHAPYVGDSVEHGSAERWYVYWKALFTLSLLFALWLGSRLKASGWRQSLLTCVLLAACLVEPVILISVWWPGMAKPTARFATPALTTRFLQQFSPELQRVYVRANGAEEETSSRPRFDALDRTALFGLHNVAGYEQLFMERYSRALGNVDFDAVNPRPGYTATHALFEPRSHVLDLLSTGFVVVWPDLEVVPAVNLIERQGVRFAAKDLARELRPGEVVNLRAAGATGDTLALVTSLANSVALAQGSAVARVRVLTSDARIIERELRAGADTAEWAHERADVRAALKHGLASVFDSAPGDAAGSYPALRYWTRVPLSASESVSRIEIASVTATATLALWKATLYDSRDGHSTPLMNESDTTTLDPARWQIETELEGVVVLRNKRALPRAWLVAKAEAVDGEEALRRIRGEDAREFDPRRTALLEVRPDELPQLPGDDIGSESSAHFISYEANRLQIETSAPMPTVLVVSEIFYPGWVASVDGRPTQILLTDYLLRGIALPAGVHTVELRYAAPAARNGAILSALTLCLLAGLGIYARRRHTRQTG